MRTLLYTHAPYYGWSSANIILELITNCYVHFKKFIDRQWPKLCLEYDSICDMRMRNIKWLWHRPCWFVFFWNSKTTNKTFNRLLTERCEVFFFLMKTGSAQSWGCFFCLTIVNIRCLCLVMSNVHVQSILRFCLDTGCGSAGQPL